MDVSHPIRSNRRHLIWRNESRLDAALLGILALLFVGTTHRSAAQDVRTTITLYGNYHTMGVQVAVPIAADPDFSASATLEYRRVGETAFRMGFPPSRIPAPVQSPTVTFYIGSLFWLEPSTSYEVRVTFHDPGGQLDGVVAQAVGATRLEAHLFGGDRFVHVSPQGSDATGDGSLTKPYATIRRALAGAGPGTQVMLHQGTYLEGEITITSGGAPTKPLVIRGFPGEKVVLDGCGPTTSPWVTIGDHLLRTVASAPNPNMLCLSHNRLFPYQSMEDLLALKWGLPGFYAEGSSVTVYTSSTINPSDLGVSRFNHAFRIEQDNVQFWNLEFRHYGRSAPGLRGSHALYILNASGIFISQCTFSMNDGGVHIGGNASRITVQDCHFQDTVSEWPYDALRENDRLEAGGLRVYSNHTGRGLVVRRNEFHGLFDGLGVCAFNGGPFNLTRLTNETDVYENVVHDCAGDALETDGQCVNVRIWGNTFYNIVSGVSLAPVYGGPVYCLRNVMYGEPVPAGSGTPFKIGSPAGSSPAGPMFLFHNTAAMWKGLYIGDGAWRQLTSRNNIWVGRQGYAFSNVRTTAPLDLDYDNLYHPFKSTPAFWMGRELTLADLQTTAGLERHGMSVDPEVESLTSGLLRLRAGSPLIDAGVVIPGINDDFAGAGPDVGAWEVRPAATRTRRWTQYY